LAEVNQFADIVLRNEIVNKIRKVFMLVFHLQPEKLFTPLLEKFSDVTNGIFDQGKTCSLYFSPPNTNYGRVSELPAGYCFGVLQEGHVKFVSSTWARDLGLTDESLFDVENYVAINMKRPHVAVYYKDEESPVGWMLVYADASIGQLHVVKNHRRKGIGRLIVRKLTQIVIDVHGVRPHVMIKVQNDSSSKLFLSEGWNKAPKPYRIVFSQK
jgi:GNAT superfamily N-acetyltransferase